MAEKMKINYINEIKRYQIQKIFQLLKLCSVSSKVFQRFSGNLMPKSDNQLEFADLYKKKRHTSPIFINCFNIYNFKQIF